MSTVTGVALGVAGIAVGVLAPKIISVINERLNPGGRFSKINSSKAGARTHKALQEGDHPLQLYSMATPNGQKVTIALEEMGLKYDAWYINIMDEDQFTSGFVAVNPNSKIPCMVDKDGPGGKSLNLFESGNILLYLAEKTGKFIPKDAAAKVECLNWLFFQIGEAPYFGQYGHFARYAPVKIPYGINRYKVEVMRALDVLDKQLEGKSYLCGEEYTIADMAWFPWVRCLDVFYKASEVVGLKEYHNVMAWYERLEARPSVSKGLLVNSSQEGGFKEYHS
ncbi:unnamed protein product [Choristocarpus tenellus]